MNDNIDDIDFSDPPGFVDDEDFMSDWTPKRPQETDGIDSVVVVDNIPQVGEKLFEKLQKVIKKIFDDFGTIVSEHYPVDDSGKTKGYIFLEYQNPNDALAAVKAIDGYKLDKNHTFTVNLFSDFDKYENIPDEWEPPQPQPYKDHGNLQSWLLEPHCYDQFSTIYDGGERTAIMQNTHNEPTVIEDRQRWTETYVKWSPRGTYLATFHGQGIALWGSEKFVQIMRFSHPGVQLIEFSPCEKYMISFSPNATHGDAPQAIIWDVFTGQKKRTFQCPQAASWPIFKWNSDGKYFARMAPDALSVYETPSFNLLDKKSIKVKGIRDFEWSPTDNYISYWTPEEREVPARVTLIEIPSRTQTSVKNLFTVADCKLHWQKSGDFLCVKLDRYKSKKEEKDAQIKYMGLYHNFNIFRIREKNIPVEIVELKESILAFAWEPVGNKFAVIQGDAPRISCVIYAVNEKGVEPLKTFDKITANHLFWSPMGQFLVLAGLRSMNGTLEFVDTSDMTTMNQAEHYLATDVEWDPTGRYVVTSVSFWGHKMENAYWIWNFQGKLLQKQPMENFCQFLWRPRPPTLLSSEQLKEVKRNVKKLYHRFQLEDKQRDSKVSKELIDKRRAVMKEYELWRSRIDEIYEAERDRRLELRGGIDTDEMGNEEMLEETIEFLVKVEESLVTE